jgi:alkaline phosphatase D
MPKERSAHEGLHFDFPDGEMTESLALGDVTDRSVRIWARLPDGPREVTLSIDRAPVAQGTLTPDPARDHVGAVVLRLDTPRPGEAFNVDAHGMSRQGRFAPTPDRPAAFGFAFGSCHQPFEERVVDSRLKRHDGARIYPAARQLAEERDTRFLMLLGDQVYSDAVSNLSVRKRLADDEGVTDDDLVATYRHLYRGYFNERGFRELAESLPAYLIWDDHDIYDGAGSLMRPSAFDERLRNAAGQAYREYQHLRNPGANVDDSPPFAYPFWFADVGFYVLDLRGMREFNERRLLGEAQWESLDAFLAEADERGTPTVFIAASVPVVHESPAIASFLEGLRTSPGHDVRDRWDVPHFRHERKRLLERLFSWQSARPHRQVVILSGDVHVGAAFSLRPRDRRQRGHISQWTSSALSTPTGIDHVIANKIVTGLVRFGERSLRVWGHGLVPTNNIGFVDVEPNPAGGHDLTFRAFAYDRKRDQLREALTIHSVPTG